MLLRALKRADRLTVGVLGALVVAGSLWFFTIDSGWGFRGPRVDGDGIYFWLYLRSLVMDGDVDFSNDYAAYGNPWSYGPTAKGLPMNPATVGSALCWMPFYLPAHGVVLLAAKAGVAVRTDGTSHAEELAAFYGSFLCGVLAVWLTIRLCRRHFGRGPALLAAVGAAVGGALIFYAVVQPSYSHAPGAFALAAFVERWDATRRERSLKGWLVLGALGGLAVLVRPQLAVAALLPLCDIAFATHEIVRPGAERRRALLRLGLGVLLGVGAALLVFSPQMLIWQVIHGRPLVIPQGQSFMQWGDSLWSEALWHPRAGLVPWMPLALPAIVGLALLAARERRLGLPLVGLLAATAYVNGASWDWWAGYSFGARRFTEIYVVLGVGLAALLDALWRWARRRSEAVLVGVAVVVVLGFAIFNFRLLQNRRFNHVDWYSNPQFHTVYAEGLRGLVRDVHNTVGNPFSWPANLIFAARHGVPPGRYDEVAGRYFLDEKHGITHAGWPKKLHDTLDLGHRGMAPYLDRGFGQLTSAGGRPAVLAVEERACVLLPLIQRPDVKLAVGARAVQGRVRVEVTVNGRSVGGAFLETRFQDLELAVPAGVLERGVNKLCFSHEVLGAAAQGTRAIGRTGVSAPVDVAALGGASDAGDWSEIWVGGRRVGPNQRGMNAVAVEPRGGAVIGVSSFDLSYWPEGGRVFERWAEGLAPGTIVALAVRTDGSRLFDGHALRALRAIGAATDLRLRPRLSYAAIGVKGAPPASALEAAANGRQAVAVAGHKPRPWVGLAEYARLSLQVTREMVFR